MRVRSKTYFLLKQPNEHPPSASRRLCEARQLGVARQTVQTKVQRRQNPHLPSRVSSLDVLDLVLLLRGRFCLVSKREPSLVMRRTTIRPFPTADEGTVKTELHWRKHN